MYVNSIYIMEALSELWKVNGYPSAAKLWQIVKLKGLKLTNKEVQEFVKSTKTAQLHKPIVKKRDYEIPIVTWDYCKDWQADLLDMQKFSRQNKGYRWILIIVDLFNREAWAIPLKDKTAAETAKAIDKVMGMASCQPLKFTTDDGGEFKGATDTLLKKKKVYHRVTEKGDHNVLGVIDRFSKTIKNMIYKHFTENDTTVWVDVLAQYIKNYNEIPHSGICGMSPNEAKKYDMSTQQCHLEKLKDRKTYRFKVGDSVRVRTEKGAFERGYESRWSKVTYEITAKEGQYFTLSNNKSYRGEMLQKVEKVKDVVKQPVKKTALENAKVSAKKKRLARKEVAVGHEAEKVDEEGRVIFKKRLRPTNQKRAVRAPKKFD